MTTPATAAHPPGWIPRNTLAARLVLLRREMGWTQREAALATGVPFGSWQSMEDGRSARGLDAKVAAIVRATECNRDWLMWGEGTPPDGLPRLDSNQKPPGFWSIGPGGGVLRPLKVAA